MARRTERNRQFRSPTSKEVFSLRRHLKLSMRELGEKLGVYSWNAASTLNNWEKGKHSMSEEYSVKFWDLAYDSGIGRAELGG